MKIITTFCLLTCILLTQACTSETWKRGVHDTLENVKQMDCERIPGDCPDRESYDDYKRKREEAVRK